LRRGNAASSPPPIEARPGAETAFLPIPAALAIRFIIINIVANPV
jgi:hypothetical protein